MKLKHIVVGCGTCTRLLFLEALAGCGSGEQTEEQAMQMSSTAFEPDGATPKGAACTTIISKFTLLIPSLKQKVA